MTAVTASPQLIHAIAGRARIHVPGCLEPDLRALRTCLRQLPGIRAVDVSPATGNVLVHFDPGTIDQDTVLDAVRAFTTEHPQTAVDAGRTPVATGAQQSCQVSCVRDRRGHVARARIAVPGLDRDPHLARRVVEQLQRHPGVRAKASMLTGRVLVEFETHQPDIDDFLDELSTIDLPDRPGSLPAHPLDPGPVIQSAARAAGSVLGLVLVAARRSLGIQALAPESVAQGNAIVGILTGFPFVRARVRRLFGHDVGDLALTAPAIVGLALSDSPLGLVLTGAEAWLLFTTVMARRQAFKRLVEREESAAGAQPGEEIRLEAGERAPFAGQVLSGTGTAVGPDGLPVPLAPGRTVPSATRVFGGPFVIHLETPDGFTPAPRPVPLAPTLYDRYANVVAPASLAYAALKGGLTRSFAGALEGLLLVTPRVAVIGMESANVAAAARVLRGGVTVIGSRPDRHIRHPDMLLLDGPRLLTMGFELAATVPVAQGHEVAEMQERAAAVAVAAGSPWGGALRSSSASQATDGSFDGAFACARVGGIEYTLGPVKNADVLPAAQRLRHRGEYLLELRSEREEQPLGILALRPRLAPGVAELVEACRKYSVVLAMLTAGDPVAAQSISRRTHVPLLTEMDAGEAIRARQAEGLVVAFASDSAHAAEAFTLCDLAVGVSDGRSRLQAPADLLAPDLAGIAAIVEAGTRRDWAIRGAVGLSALSNMGGGVLGLRGPLGIRVASQITYATSLGSLAFTWMLERGGEHKRPLLEGMPEPRPERWGRQSVESVLHAMDTSAGGLSSDQAASRMQRRVSAHATNPLFAGIVDQLRSPLTMILAAGAVFSAVGGGIANAAIIGATIAVNAGAGAWQEHQADVAARALDQLNAPNARVVRDGEAVQVPADEVVPGDVLSLTAGDRIVADARVISADGLEVDEAALTGESLPVAKLVHGGTDASRIVLEGTDVTAGTGRAVVVAVGRNTRMGATAAALASQEVRQSPLGLRLSRMLAEAVPISLAAGAIVAGSGLLRGEALLPQVGLAAAIALAAVPEGLPLLARMGEASVARRLAGQNAVVRHLSAIEALGRVDVACVDKTGTLTQGRLALTLVVGADDEARVPGPLSGDLERVLLTAALASPHPEGESARSHPTDVAVLRAADDAGLGASLRVRHDVESPFDPVRSFHATLANGSLHVKGAPEVLIPRCTRMRRNGWDQPIDEEERGVLQARARKLAGRGLRVLMVASGSRDQLPEDPRNLVALGFVGISDPLRPMVAASVKRCRDAGVRVIMLTGDHPATARTIAREAGLLEDGEELLSAGDLVELQNGELDERLEHAAVIARATPLDKLRIIESLQRRRHAVAMTGDGVNDAPALRLADVGVAMGHGGTEVARQTADMVLVDDDFATLVEAFVEGRSFWRNIRRALGLLIGGNLGELGLIVGGSVFGLPDPLNVRQILVVNMLTDILPALAIALQRPETRVLSGLAIEGTAALDRPLRYDIARRAGTSAVPALAAYALALPQGTMAQASTVAFASIVSTQLAHTLDAGRSEGQFNAPVVGAVGGSLAMLGTAVFLPGLRTFLGLEVPTPFGWALAGGATLAAAMLSRLIATPSRAGGLPAPLPRLQLPRPAHGAVE